MREFLASGSLEFRANEVPGSLSEILKATTTSLLWPIGKESSREQYRLNEKRNGLWQTGLKSHGWLPIVYWLMFWWISAFSLRASCSPRYVPPLVINLQQAKSFIRVPNREVGMHNCTKFIEHRPFVDKKQGDLHELVQPLTYAYSTRVYNSTVASHTNLVNFRP